MAVWKTSPLLALTCHASFAKSPCAQLNSIGSSIIAVQLLKFTMSGVDHARQSMQLSSAYTLTLVTGVGALACCRWFVAMQPACLMHACRWMLRRHLLEAAHCLNLHTSAEGTRWAFRCRQRHTKCTIRCPMPAHWCHLLSGQRHARFCIMAVAAMQGIEVLHSLRWVTAVYKGA